LAFQGPVGEALVLLEPVDDDGSPKLSHRATL
jgi:hypothetical protein